MCLISSPMCRRKAADGRWIMVNMQSAQLTELIHYVCGDLFNDNVNSSCLKQKHFCDYDTYVTVPPTKKTMKRCKNISPN